MKCIICKKEFEAVTNKKACSANCAKIRKAQKDKEFYLKNNKAIKEYKKEWQQKNKDKIKERLRQYYEENKEKIKERSSRWRKNNLERKKVTNLLWELNNPEKVKEGRKKYRDRVKNDPQFRLKDNPGNLCISCPSCNLKKGAKMPYEFAGVLF